MWCKKPDKVKRQVFYQNYQDGGLRVPNFEVMSKALKLAWIGRFLSVQQPHGKETWKVIPEYFFGKFGGLNFFLRCTYDKRSLNNESIPVFYKEILLSFLELKSLYHTQFGQDFILLNNKEILIEGKTFFLKNWYQKRVICIQVIYQTREGVFHQISKH